MFMGHRQHPGEKTGIEVLYFELRKLYGTHPVEIRLYEWRDDVQRIADQIHAWSIPEPTIIVIGYSWGGATAELLCRELERRGYAISRLYLCDAVSRSEWRIRYWRSLWGWGPIRIPGNVVRLWSCRQTANYPMGSELKLDNPHTEHIQGFTSTTINHRWMDEQTAFHYRVIKDLQFLAV
jgi:pimeloyl-ACP methyl ester carboxylesterase